MVVWEVYVRAAKVSEERRDWMVCMLAVVLVFLILGVWSLSGGCLRF